MADLGGKTALKSDLDAKVTTNGANENTGARVNAGLTNIIDTLFGVANMAPTLTFSFDTDLDNTGGPSQSIRFNNAAIASTTAVAFNGVVNGVNKGDLFTNVSGILRGHVLGTTDTFEFRIIGTPVFGLWTVFAVEYLSGSKPASGAECAIDFLPSAGSVRNPQEIVVSGAGTPAANGTYFLNGQAFAYPNVVAVSVDGAFEMAIRDEDGPGVVKFEVRPFGGGTVLYSTPNFVTSPIGATWEVNDGAAPAPTVTQGYQTIQAALDRLAKQSQTKAFSGLTDGGLVDIDVSGIFASIISAAAVSTEVGKPMAFHVKTIDTSNVKINAFYGVDVVTGFPIDAADGFAVSVSVTGNLA